MVPVPGAVAVAPIRTERLRPFSSEPSPHTALPAAVVQRPPTADTRWREADSDALSVTPFAAVGPRLATMTVNETVLPTPTGPAACLSDTITSARGGFAAPPPTAEGATPIATPTAAATTTPTRKILSVHRNTFITHPSSPAPRVNPQPASEKPESLASILHRPHAGHIGRDTAFASAKTRIRQTTSSDAADAAT
jgi:hypothetical protein